MQIHVLQCLILGCWNGLDRLEYQDCGESMRWWVILQVCVINFAVSGQCDICHIFEIYSKVCLVWWMFVPHRLFTGNLCVQSPKRDLGTYKWEKRTPLNINLRPMISFCGCNLCTRSFYQFEMMVNPRDPITSWEWWWNPNTMRRRWLNTPIMMQFHYVSWSLEISLPQAWCHLQLWELGTGTSAECRNPIVRDET